MTRVSVLIPTHEHATTLPYAVASVQEQGVDDLEILICGDGVTDEVRKVVAELQAADRRIRFFDLPKAPRTGESNRDQVLRQAGGDIVCYQSDDDLWLPGHLAALEEALADAEFAGAMQVNVDEGRVRGHYFDLERPEFVGPWLDWRPNDFGAWACNGFGLSFVAHRLDAYLRLPEGWATTPAGLPTDQPMWHKFMREPWCRARFLRWPIALHFPSTDRRHSSPAQRAAELAEWSAIVNGPEGMGRVWRALLVDMGDRLLQQSLADRQAWQEMTSVRDHLAAELEREPERLAAELTRERDRHTAELERERGRFATELDGERRRLGAEAERQRGLLIAELQAERNRLAELERERSRLAAEGEQERARLVAELEREHARFAAELEGERGRLAAEREGRARAERERDALLSSTIWRATAPLRAVVDVVKRLRLPR